jgi:hypothetical protein
MKPRILAVLIMIAALPAAAASTQTPTVDQRQANQEARIQQGVQSGQLTPKEDAKLEKAQGKIEADKEKAQADGKVTSKERKKLAKEQNKQSKKIHKQKHDKQATTPKS